MNYRYELASVGASPIDLTTAKSYLKVGTTADDSVIQNMINAATDFAERYTGRDMRANTWHLFLDSFDDRICLRKASVNSITSIEYKVSGALTTIANTVWQLKPGNEFSEIILKPDQIWPVNIDDGEETIKIIFVTKAPRYIDEYKLALFEHVAHLYQNRGDFDIVSSAKGSGAVEKYNQGRIQRI